MNSHDTVIVESVTQEMLNWLEENEIEHLIQPNMVRWKHVFVVRNNEEAKKQYRREGTQIIFTNEKDKLYFEMAWGETVKSGAPSMWLGKYR